MKLLIILRVRRVGVIFKIVYYRFLTISAVK